MFLRCVQASVAEISCTMTTYGEFQHCASGLCAFPKNDHCAIDACAWMHSVCKHTSINAEYTRRWAKMSDRLKRNAQPFTEVMKKQVRQGFASIASDACQKR